MGKIGDQLQKDGLTDDSLLRLFRQAEKELISIVARIDPSSPFRDFRAKQIRAIEAVIFELQTGIEDWTQTEIPKLVRAGASEAEEAIAAFNEAEFTVDFSGISKRAIDVLAEEAFLEFGKTMVNIRTNTALAILQRRKLQERIIQGVIQGSSVARTQTQLIAQMRKSGIPAMTDRAGRNWNPERYANMLVRTQSMTAYNIGARAQMIGMGRRFAIFPTIRPDIDGQDICNEWERKKYIDLKKDPLPPQSTHPNCRHFPKPVSFDQLRRERPDLYRVALAEVRSAKE